MTRLPRLSPAHTAIAALVLSGLATGPVETQSRRAMTTEADFRLAMEELSNWGRWGKTDQLGALNLITPDICGRCKLGVRFRGRARRVEHHADSLGTNPINPERRCFGITNGSRQPIAVNRHRLTVHWDQADG